MDRRVYTYNFHKWSVEFVFNTLYMYILYTLPHHLHQFHIFVLKKNTVKKTKCSKLEWKCIVIVTIMVYFCYLCFNVFTKESQGLFQTVPRLCSHLLSPTLFWSALYQCAVITLLSFTPSSSVSLSPL